MKCDRITDNGPAELAKVGQPTTARLSSPKSVNLLMLPIIALLAFTSTAHAVRVADITRLSGQRTNVLTGLGLVFGLKGTGDGGDFGPAIKPLASMLGNFSDPATVAELTKVQNVAVVSISAVIPSTGARDGDKIDVHVTSIGAASTLKGGRLCVCPLMGPLPNSGLFALAQGPVELEDPNDPNVGIVQGGAVMEASVPVKYVDNGRIGLIIEAPSASWTIASLIAKTINDAEGQAGEQLAFAIDAKEVVVTIPLAEREHPDAFISRVQQLPVPMVSAEARVLINTRTGTMVITGDVEISPVVVVQKGMTITTVNPPPTPTVRNPITSTRETVALATGAQTGTRLQDLVNAFDQLKVPVEDRIAIIRKIYAAGKLHAKLIEEQG